ncbi:MAG TPA: 30S ribosomal protein S6 [Planctomycetaceae bacterium]|nr:30S ribosomal protein S6 [Planctomycetaceae bacterium]
MAATEQATDKTATHKLYEGMFLLDSGRFATDAKGATDQITGMIEKCGGTLVAHRPWQDGRLAYAIKGHRKGLHYLTYFKMPGDGIRDLTRACKLNELVLRHVVIEHPQAMFEAMVQAISGEWHPHEAIQDEPTARGRGDRDRGDRDRGDRDRGDRDRGDRDRGERDDRGRGDRDDHERPGEPEGEYEE